MSAKNAATPVVQVMLPNSGVFNSGRTGTDLLSLHEVQHKSGSASRPDDSVADLVAVLT